MRPRAFTWRPSRRKPARAGPRRPRAGPPSTQEFKGYVFRITGGQDKEGFAMKQGVLVPHRVRLLMTPGDQGFRGFGRRNGERRRKSVRGCIVSQDLSLLNLVVVKQGESDIPGLTDRTLPAMRGPKRASNIRKLFNLSKEDNVQLPKYVNLYRRTFEGKDGKKHSKAPRIQVRSQAGRSRWAVAVAGRDGL